MPMPLTNMMGSAPLETTTLPLRRSICCLVRAIAEKDVLLLLIAGMPFSVSVLAMASARCAASEGQLSAARISTVFDGAPSGI